MDYEKEINELWRDLYHAEECGEYEAAEDILFEIRQLTKEMRGEK